MQKEWVKTMETLRGGSKFQSRIKWLAESDFLAASKMFAQDELVLPGLFASITPRQDMHSKNFQQGALCCSNCQTRLGDFRESSSEAGSLDLTLSTWTLGTRRHRHEIQITRELERSSSP
jgi:hypothetical protein